MANVVIDIAAEFTGNKAFKQAENSTDKLIKNVKKLAGATGLAFGTAQVIAFGKASVKAALEAQAQQERLASLLKVTVGARDSEIQSLNDQANALEKIGVVNKDNITQVQSQLATFNLQVDTIKALTPAVLDYVTAEKGATASADEFKSMTNGLAQALNGNFASLTKVGFVLDEQTKKTIKSGTESERTAAIIAVLDSTYKDFNKNLGNTDSGQMAKLANAADDVKEIIGAGIIDSLKTLGKDNSVETLAENMRDVATYVANVIRGIGVLITKIGEIPILGDALKFLFTSSPLLDYLADLGKVAAIQKASDNQHLRDLEQQYKIINKTGKVTSKLTADELKKLKAKQLQNAIDKANLALGKSDEIFNMDKIQLAAAEKNQVEQLGKVTNQAQLLAITNDLARLQIKKDIIALEDAIASKDEAAITAATNKLNADLKIYGALTNQEIKLTEIKSILDKIAPKDLINLDNLYTAIDLLGKISNTPITNVSTVSPAQQTVADVIGARSGFDISGATDPRVTYGGQRIDSAGNYTSFNPEMLGMTAGGSAGGSTPVNITVNTGIGDPNAIAEAVVTVINEAAQRGTLTGTLGVR